MIGGRQGEPELRTAHLVGEWSGGQGAVHPPRGLRSAPPVFNTDAIARRDVEQFRCTKIGPGSHEVCQELDIRSDGEGV